MYTINGTEYNEYGTTNQRILDKFTNRDIYAYVSDMITDLQSAEVEDYTLDNFDNSTRVVCSECGSNEDCDWIDVLDDESIQHVAQKLGVDVEDVNPDDYYICTVCGNIIGKTSGEGSEVETAAPYEYYIVSGYLGERLRQHGAPVMERWGGWIWGREATGQSITLDSVIVQIARDMEILEGQAHSWENIV